MTLSELVLDFIEKSSPFPESATICGLPEALSAMVTAPVLAPGEVGLNTTPIAHVAPAATELPQVPLPVKAKSPLTLRLVIDKAAVPVLFKVTDCAALLLPTIWPLNDTELGVRLTVGADGELVEPESANVCGLLGALSAIVTAPVKVPVVVGAKSTLIVQLAPAATEVPQVPVPPKAKGPEIVKLPLNVRVELPVLVSVAVCAVLVLPTDWLEKIREAGERLTSGPVVEDVPVPLRVVVWGLPVALSATLKVALKVPVAEGVKVTLIVQLAAAARLVPQVLVWAKSLLLVPVIETPEMLIAPVVPFFNVTV